MAKSKSITPLFSNDRPVRCVALYARVSTLNGQQDPEMQLSELREYASRRGLTIYQEYVDQGAITEASGHHGGNAPMQCWRSGAQCSGPTRWPLIST
jgi:resolvase-like protein